MLWNNIVIRSNSTAKACKCILLSSSTKQPMPKAGGELQGHVELSMVLNGLCFHLLESFNITWSQPWIWIVFLNLKQCRHSLELSMVLQALNLADLKEISLTVLSCLWCWIALPSYPFTEALSNPRWTSFTRAVSQTPSQALKPSL